MDQQPRLPPIAESSAYNHQPDPYGEPDSAAATASAALSHPSSPQQRMSSAAQPRKRRTAAGPSSRGVANLTAEQLAKKRANDRAAQRAIRERTRNTIETLEQRIKELESQHPFQELQRALQERDRALAECEALRKRLAQVAGIVGGPAGSPQSQTPSPSSLHELASVTTQQGSVPAMTPQQTHQQYVLSPVGASYEQTHIHPDLRSPHSGSFPSPSARTNSSTTGRSEVPGNDMARVCSWSANREPPLSAPHGSSSGSSYDYQRSPSRPAQHQPTGPLDVKFLVDQSNQLPPYQPPQVQFSPPIPPPLWSRVPNTGVLEDQLDLLFLSFVRNQRSLLDDGAPSVEAIGPDYPNLNSLHPSATNTENEGHPMSQLMIDLAKRFPFQNILSVRVAVLYIVFLFLRWIICPCESCYLRLPPWMRPIEEQLDVYHASWRDYLPWPSIRRGLIPTDSLEEAIKFDDFVIPYVTTLSLNWPYPEEHIFRPLEAGATTPPVELNPVYEAHLRDLKNWSLGAEFKRAFPRLVSEEVRIM